MTSFIAAGPSFFCSTFTFPSLFPLAFPLFPLRPSVSSYGLLPLTTIRCFSPPSATSSSLNHTNPKWSNNHSDNPAILLDGCDFQHWLVVVQKPDAHLTRDEIINFYINTLAIVLGSKEEARMKIYSVSTRCYYAFGALVSEELSLKIKELPVVRWVLPDSYLDVKNKDYGGEPFVEGRAVPYDPKYHEEWIRNNQWESERKRRRNERPHNFDRSRNYERRWQNVSRPATTATSLHIFNNSRRVHSTRPVAETWAAQKALSIPSPDGEDHI